MNLTNWMTGAPEMSSRRPAGPPCCYLKRKSWWMSCRIALPVMKSLTGELEMMCFRTDVPVKTFRSVWSKYPMSSAAVKRSFPTGAPVMMNLTALPAMSCCRTGAPEKTFRSVLSAMKPKSSAAVKRLLPTGAPVRMSRTALPVMTTSGSGMRSS